MSHRGGSTSATSSSYELSSFSRPSYTPLASTEESAGAQSSKKAFIIRKFGGKLRRATSLLLCISVVLNVVLSWYSLRSETTKNVLTYSPAQHVVRYEPVVFASAFGVQRSPFQGKPSEENNQLWDDLYDFGITKLSAEEARPMDNKTLPIPREGGYLVQLAVFHQLHCLNMIRRGLYGEVDRSNKDDVMGIEHLDHCVDMIRQSLMCTSDITPLTFARTSRREEAKAVAEVVHTCRDFAAIQRWAYERQLQNEFDRETIVTDDPLGWGSYEYSP